MPRRQSVRTLKQLCLSNVAANMTEVWAKDYTDNYLTDYNFLYIMGPFSDLASSLVEDVLQLLGETRRLNRAFLHLLLVPHLVELSLRCCSGLVSNAIAQIIHIRCQGLTSLDLYGCSRIQSAILADLIGCLPRLRKLCLLGTQCNSRVLSAIGGRCGELRELDVSQCKEVTPRGLLHLVYDQSRATFTVLQLRRLLTERVALCPSEVTHQAVTVAFLLLALPRLECVAHTFLAEALTLIHGQHFGSGQQFLQSCGFPSLAEVVRSGPRSWAGAGVDRSTLGLRRLDVALDHNLALLTSTCTQVVEAIIVRDDGLTDLAHLTSWGKLTHLTLECSGLCGRPLGEVMPVLSRLGPQLRLLSLQNFRCQPEASLGEVLGFCPILRVLQAQLHLPVPGVEQAPPEEGSDEEDDTDSDGCLASCRFLHLKEFGVRIVDWAGTAAGLPRRSALPLSTTLISALRDSPVLAKVSLVNIPLSLDRVFRSALSRPGALAQLTEVSLAQSRVSTIAVQLLMEADNQLASLDLRQCRDIHLRHYQRFLNQAHRSKLDLKIFWE